MPAEFPVTADQLLSLIGTAAGYPAPDGPDDDFGPFGPIVRGSWWWRFGPHPDPWRTGPMPEPWRFGPRPEPWLTDIIDRIGLNSQPLPPKAIIRLGYASAVAAAAVEQLLASFDLARNFGADWTEAAFAGQTRALERFIDDCGNGRWPALRPHRPPPRGEPGPRPNELLAMALEWHTVAAQLDEELADVKAMLGGFVDRIVSLAVRPG